MAAATRANLLKKAIPFLKVISESKDLTVVAFVMAVLAIIIVPLPSTILDFFLAVSFAVAVLILLISLYVGKPDDFDAFPTLLLIVTLFRLSLNVATTRMILSNGHEGPEAVSSIIASFGEFVVGGNYVIGIIVFLILVIINFMVVTNGSTRVAEVAARFTLDAMPGKQMAIDADLNSGLIDENEAKARRTALATEADFYGSMDGASKFVKGDASAGIIITLINIIGGFLIGVFQHDMSVGDSAKTFTILTIGDGLVGQLPALMISTATGIIVTRSTKDDKTSFATGVIDQLMKENRILIIVGSILMLFAMVPGLPTLSLGFVGSIFLIMAYLMHRQQSGAKGLLDILEGKLGVDMSEKKKEEIKKKEKEEAEKKKAAEPTPEEQKKQEEEALNEILKVEILELDLGYQLIRLADKNQGGDLLERIRGMRRKIAADHGFLMPQVRIRDNLQLPPTTYQILLKGVSIGDGEVIPDRFLAMNSGMVTEEVEGVPTKEPAFGLDALWIEPRFKEDAIMGGYTVVDPATVIATHLSELVKKHAEELLTRQETHTLIEKIAKDFPIVVEDTKRVASTGLIQQVLKSLLNERVPIKDMLTIMETIADVAQPAGGSVDIIVEQVRARLARVITNLYKDGNGVLKLVTLSAPTEQYLLDRLKDQHGARSLLLNVTELNTLIEAVSLTASKVLQSGVAPVIIIVDPLLRKALSEKLGQFGLDVVVLSHAEVDGRAKFEVLGSVEASFSDGSKK